MGRRDSRASHAAAGPRASLMTLVATPEAPLDRALRQVPPARTAAPRARADSGLAGALIRIGSIAASTLLGLVLARCLGPAELGRFDTALGWAGLVGRGGRGPGPPARPRRRRVLGDRRPWPGARRVRLGASDACCSPRRSARARACRWRSSSTRWRAVSCSPSACSSCPAPRPCAGAPRVSPASGALAPPRRSSSSSRRS